MREMASGFKQQCWRARIRHLRKINKHTLKETESKAISLIFGEASIFCVMKESNGTGVSAPYKREAEIVIDINPEECRLTLS